MSYFGLIYPNLSYWLHLADIGREGISQIGNIQVQQNEDTNNNGSSQSTQDSTRSTNSWGASSNFQTIDNNSKEYGSFQCAKFRAGKKCDLCKHMVQTNFVTSGLYNQKFRIHGHLAHDVSEANKLRWFIYLIEDLPCKKAIVGSTTKPTSRWSTHKSNCNNGPSNATGLSKHFTTKGGMSQ